MKIGVMHGPNLGRLGTRIPDLYGTITLDVLHRELREAFGDVDLSFFQSNSEGALIDQLEAWKDEGLDRVALNPGALTHQSYALRDAIEGLDLTVVEVHISNIFQRESFRAQSLTAPVTRGLITGLGIYGYHVAVAYLRSMV